MHPLFVAILVTAATWKAWHWYLERVGTSPEEAASLALTVMFLGVLGFARRHQDAAPRSLPLWTVALVLMVYAASTFVLPPIARAAIAIAATLFAFHVAIFKEK